MTTVIDNFPIERTLPSGALVQVQLLEWMWAYHPWDSYVQKNNTLKNI
jgi:hypothetical protein